MKRFIISIIVLISSVSCQYVWAQEAPKHEFSVYNALGLSSLRYHLSQGDRSGGFGGDFGVGYTWYRTNVRVTGTGKVFYEQWGIFTGLGLGLYNAKAKLNEVKKVTEDMVDSENDPFVLNTTLKGYKETQKTTYLNIPVMAQFQIERYYILTGLKFGIPLGGKYKSKDATVTNIAYYPGYDPDYISPIQGPRTQGLGVFPDKDSDGKLKFGVALMLSLEGGVNWRINKNFSLYSGMYFDIGLNNNFKDKKLPFVEFDYNAAEVSSRFTTNSVLNSFTEKVNIMAVGVKVRLAYVR